MVNNSIKINKKITMGYTKSWNPHPTKKVITYADRNPGHYLGQAHTYVINWSKESQTTFLLIIGLSTAIQIYTKCLKDYG
jgi:hypothetical protein